MPTSPTSAELASARWFAALLVLLLLAHALAAATPVPGATVPLFWPASGVMTAGYVRTPAQKWRALTALFFVAGAAGHAFLAQRGWSALAYAAIDAAVAAVAASLFAALAKGDHQLRSRRSVLALLAAGAVCGAVYAAADFALRQALGWQSPWPFWSVPGLVGVMLAGPVLMDWESILRRPGRRRNAPGGVVEFLALLAAVAGVSLAIYANLIDIGPFGLFATLLPIPIVVWGGTRLTRSEAVLLIIVAGGIALRATTHGLGPLAALPGPGGAELMWLKLILLVGVITTLLLSASVAEWREARRAVLEKVALLDAVVETSNDAVITIDQRGLVQSFSHAAERLFGYRASEVIGRNVKMLMPPHFAEQHDGYIARYLTTGEKRIIGIGRVVAGRRRDGTTFPMELSVGETLVEGQRIFTGFVRDLTEIQRAEKRIQEIQAELFHVGRVAEMGQLASSLAHEVNQPLAAIANYAEAARYVLASAPAPPSGMPDLLDKIEAQSRRAAEIIRRLRGFIEKHDVERSTENINVVIEEALALALVGSRDRALRLHLKLAPDLPPAWIERIHIQQVLVNLVRNARDAMASSPRREITIEAVRDSDQIRISVIDTGPGLADEVATRLFEPFVTTKPDGMGVGLSICKTIIEGHGGRLWHEPNRDGGAIFRFTVPVARS
jgi:two-component system sensor kinase FixL